MLPSSYNSKVIQSLGTDNRSDIEKILDSVAKNSGLFEEEKKLPEKFEFRWQNWSDKQKKQYSNYKKRLNKLAKEGCI